MVNSPASRIRGLGIDRPITEAEKLAEALGAPEKVKDDVRLFIEGALSRHRNLSVLAVIAASVYAACRKNGVPVTLGEVSRSMNPKVELGRIAQYYKRLYDEVFHEQAPQVATVERYVTKVARVIHLPPSITNSALQLINDAKGAGNGTLGRHPAVVGAAAVYLAAQKAGLDVTQQMVTTSAGLSDVGRVREAVKSLRMIEAEKETGPQHNRGES